MLKFLPLFAISITSVLAAQRPGPLIVRRGDNPTDCSQVNRITCGQACIKPEETCCPDSSGGCPQGSNCVLGSNNQYGCCPGGETCEGPGGAETNTIPVVVTSSVMAYETSLAMSIYPTPTYQPPPYPTTTPQEQTTQVPSSGTAPGTTYTPPPSQTGTGTGTGTGTAPPPFVSSTSLPVIPPNSAPANSLSVGVLGGLFVGAAALLL